MRCGRGLANARDANHKVCFEFFFHIFLFPYSAGMLTPQVVNYARNSAGRIDPSLVAGRMSARS